MVGRKVQDVHSILQAYGPRGSSFVKKKLAADGLSDAALRQRIARARVQRLSHSLLPSQEKFLYLPGQEGTEQFNRNLRQALVEGKTSYGAALSALNARGGAMPEYLFRTFSGCPDQAVNKRLSSKEVLQKLKEAELVHDEVVPEHGTIIVDGTSTIGARQLSEMNARLRAEEVIIAGLSKWLAKLGLVGYESVRRRTRTNIPKVGAFCFDITGPSYVSPLIREAGKPGFFVADVIFRGGLSEIDVQFFLNKFNALRRHGNITTMCMLVAQHYDKKAFSSLKGRGFLLTTVENLFGRELSDSLVELVRILGDAVAAVTSDPTKLSQLLTTLDKVEGEYLNVRGDLFEVLVGYSRKQQGGYVDIRRNIVDPGTGERAEIDVLYFDPEIVICTECKGVKSDKAIEPGEVEDWLTRQVPRIRNYIKDNPELRAKDLEFHFWTTGSISSEGKRMLAEASKRTKKYKIQWKDRESLLAHFRQQRLKTAVQLVERHY